MSPSAERVIVAAIAAIPPTLAALSALAAALRTAKKTDQVVHAINGRLDQLVKAEAARAALAATLKAQHDAYRQLPPSVPPAVGQ